MISTVRSPGTPPGLFAFALSLGRFQPLKCFCYALAWTVDQVIGTWAVEGTDSELQVKEGNKRQSAGWENEVCIHPAEPQDFQRISPPWGINPPLTHVLLCLERNDIKGDSLLLHPVRSLPPPPPQLFECV